MVMGKTERADKILHGKPCYSNLKEVVILVRDRGEDVKVKKLMGKLLQILSHYMTGPLQEERKLYTG